MAYISLNGDWDKTNSNSNFNSYLTSACKDIKSLQMLLTYSNNSTVSTVL